jgi:hypothetical protein
MLRLYTSELDPQGQAAEKLLINKNVQYKKVIINESTKKEDANFALRLVQAFLKSSSVPLSFPFLTVQRASAEQTQQTQHAQPAGEEEERIVLFGFDPAEWESFLLLQVSSGILMPDIDLTHVPVVSPDPETVQ